MMEGLNCKQLLWASPACKDMHERPSSYCDSTSEFSTERHAHVRCKTVEEF